MPLLEVSDENKDLLMVQVQWLRWRALDTFKLQIRILAFAKIGNDFLFFNHYMKPAGSFVIKKRFEWYSRCGFNMMIMMMLFFFSLLLTHTTMKNLFFIYIIIIYYWNYFNYYNYYLNFYYYFNLNFISITLFIITLLGWCGSSCFLFSFVVVAA